MSYEYVRLNNPVRESTDIHEWIEINGRFLDGHLGLSSKYGTENAIEGGRITELLLTETDNVICYFKDGVWQMPLPDLDSEAYLAVLYFKHKYNRVISEREERKMFVHERLPCYQPHQQGVR